MPGIVEFPKLVLDAFSQYGDLLGNEPQRRHFAESLTGLVVAERTTVLGSHGEFARTTDPSCRNRFLTDADGNVDALNQRRLEPLQKDPSTGSSDQGIIPIDIHPVGTRGKLYPLEFRLFRKPKVGEAIGEPFRHHTALGCEGIDWVCQRQIPGDFSIDGSFTSAEVLNHIHDKQDRFGRPRGYVGDRKTNRKREGQGRIIQASELAASIPSADRKEMRIGDRRQWSVTVTVRLPEVNPTVRIVVLGRYRNDTEPCQILVTNRTTWEVSRIVRVDRHRGTGTETFHRDGKQQLGLGDCPWRELQGQTRQIDRVMLASSRLMGPLKQGRAKEGALHRLTTIGEACRALFKEAVRTTLSWAVDQITRFEQP